MAPDTNSEDQPRLTAREAIKQLLAIRALTGTTAALTVYKRKRTRRCYMYLPTDDGYCHYWYYRHPYLESEPSNAHMQRFNERRQKWRDNWEIFPESLRWDRASTIAGELAAITRRAYVPRLVTQIYQQHPLLLASLLKGT